MTASNNEKTGNIIKSIAALMIGSLFALIISEMILQVIDFPPRPVSGWLNCISKNPGECNPMGFRGSDIAYTDEDFVVVLLGDSETYAPNLSFNKIPERRLELNLKRFRNSVKVFTIADTGYGQDQQFLALEKYYKKYRADLVILIFTTRNDVENNIFPTAGANDTIKPTFWLKRNELHGPTESWLEPVGSRFKLALLWQTKFTQHEGSLRHQRWEKDILPPPYQPLSKYDGEVDYTWQKVWEGNPEKAFREVAFEKMDTGNQLAPRSARRLYGINLTRQLLSKIKKLVELKNGNFVIFKEERPWELQDIGNEKAYLLREKYYKMSLKQYRQNLNELFDGFELFRVPVKENNYKVSENNKHLNEKAIENLMDQLSLIISENNYFQ